MSKINGKEKYEVVIISTPFSVGDLIQVIDTFAISSENEIELRYTLGGRELFVKRVNSDGGITVNDHDNRYNDRTHQWIIPQKFLYLLQIKETKMDWFNCLDQRDKDEALQFLERGIRYYNGYNENVRMDMKTKFGITPAQTQQLFKFLHANKNPQREEKNPVAQFSRKEHINIVKTPPLSTANSSHIPNTPCQQAVVYFYKSIAFMALLQFGLSGFVPLEFFLSGTYWVCLFFLILYQFYDSKSNIKWEQFF